MPARTPTAVIKPNLGLYLDRPPIALPPGALQDGLNFRIQLGQLHNLNVGWVTFNNLQLNGPVTLIKNFTTSQGQSFLVLGSLTDLYYYNGTVLVYISPTYTTGTASASGTAVTGAGTLWNTTVTGSQWANAKAGDQIAFGASNINSLAGPWFTIQSVNSNTSITLATSAGTVASGAYTIRRRYTAADISATWNSEVFVDAAPAGKDLLFLTNGFDNVTTWNGIDPTVTLQVGLQFTCKALCQFKNTMWYGNVLQGGVQLSTTVITSDLGAPLAAGAASTGIAGQFIVSGQTVPIQNMFRIGDYIAVYLGAGLGGSVIVAQAVGAPLIYVFRIAVQNKGPISPRGISVFPYNHQFLGPDGQYTFDGNTAQPINTHIWRNVLSSVDTLRTPNIFTFLDEQNGEQLWSVPQTTDPGSGTISSPNQTIWVEHYLEETAGQAQSALIASAMGLNRPYSKRSFTNMTAVGNFANAAVLTWNQLTFQWQTLNHRWNDAFFGATFPNVVAGDINGNLWQLNSGQSGGGSVLSSFMIFGRRPLTDGRMRALLRRFYPFVDTFPGTNLTVSFGFSDWASAAVQRTATALYNESNNTQDIFFIPVYRRGRYVDITIGDANANPFKFNGYDLDILPGGMR